jgi:glycosyltransferase involved in cell wall biosynthesis
MHITILSTYPPTLPRHGGQHRIANMVRVLEGAGHQVQSIGVLGSESYPSSHGFLAFPGYEVLRRFIDNPFLMEDWAIGRWVVEDPSAYRALTRLINRKTDAILCEQPWLFTFGKRFLADIKRRKPMIVYGSQNIESELKRQIVEAYYGASYGGKCAALVLDFEIKAVSSADLILTVSQTDAEWVRKYTSAPIVVARNGVSAARASIEDVREANRITEHRKTALYVASGHPPNVFGFYDLFGEGVGCFAPNERIIVAGSAGESIRNDERFGSVSGLGRSFVDGGMVSEGQLRGLLHTAHCIFLPMTSGGGTNLKTAEALWSGRPVIATPVAMRGFEAFQNAAGVHMCSGKGEFLAAIRECMAKPRFEIDRNERQSRRSLLWSETLKPLVDAFDDRRKIDA